MEDIRTLEEKLEELQQINHIMSTAFSSMLNTIYRIEVGMETIKEELENGRS